MNWKRGWVIGLIVGGFLAAMGNSAVLAGPRIRIVTGRNAPGLEQFAAREAAAMLERLFAAQVTVGEDPTDQADATLFLGHPQSNPHVRTLAGQDWPRISKQGIVIRSVPYEGKTGLIVGGGSPSAILWSVYELGYHFGVRYLLREDIYPDGPVPLQWAGIDVVREPNLTQRAWRTIDDPTIGPQAWPLADQQRLLGQLAKLKFNRAIVAVHPWQPFIHFEAGGVAKQTGLLWRGERLEIPRDAPGRTALGGASVFQNPDFAGCENYAQRLAAGQRVVTGILEEAHRLGMSAGLSVSPLEFPREFATLLAANQDGNNREGLLIGPGGQRFDDPQLRDLVTARLRACLRTYPQLDVLYLRLPRSVVWTAEAEAAWKLLAERLGDEAPELGTLVTQAADAAGEDLRAEQEAALKTNVVALACLHQVLADPTLRQRPDGRPVELVIESLHPALFPYADRIVPEGAAVMNRLDLSAPRWERQAAALTRLPADKVSANALVSLADEEAGVLSQSLTRRLEALLAALRDQGWSGLCVRQGMLAELDPTLHYLARAAWDASVTPRSAHDELFTTIMDRQAIADRLWLAFGHLEQATELLERNDPDFARPGDGMLMKHFQAAPQPAWWEELNGQYTQAMVELYRSHDATPLRSRPRMFYWSKRSEFVLEYLAAVKAVREAALARKAGDQEKSIEQLEVAIEQLYNAIDTLGDVARDPSDRALIATLVQRAFLPLRAEYEKALDAE